MGRSIVRFAHHGQPRWGELIAGRVMLFEGEYPTLASLLADARTGGLEHQKGEIGATLPDFELLSPVTQPCQIICQGMNYRDHAAEAGIRISRDPVNVFFSKAPSSLGGARDPICRPPGVELMDYEVELGLVVGTPIRTPTEVVDDQLHDFIAGIVLANDVSARDVQARQGQWFAGKSFRGFCPAGPVLYLLERHEMPYLANLELELSVNGVFRQRSNTSQLIHKPAKTLTELSAVVDLHPGDLILTGTPGGVASRVPRGWVRKIVQFVCSEEALQQIYVRSQRSRPGYLRDGDVVRCHIRSADGVIDLGCQENRVTSRADSRSRAVAGASR